MSAAGDGNALLNPPSIAAGTAVSFGIAHNVATNGEVPDQTVDHPPETDEYTPSSLFDRSLKTIDILPGVDIVVSYNHALLKLKCKRSSLEYDASLDQDLIVKELFRPDEWWQSRELL